VGVNPVPPSPTVGGGSIGDLFAIAVSRCRRELSHCEPRAGVDSLGGDCINIGALESRFGAIRLPRRDSGRLARFRGAGSLCDQPSVPCGES